MSEFKKEIKTLQKVAKRAFKLGLQTGSGGNISIRCECRDKVVIKPSGVGFAELDEEEWELVDDLEFALWLTEQSELADPSQSS